MDDVEMPRAEGGAPGSMRSRSRSSSSSSCSRSASLPRAGVQDVRWQDQSSADDDDHPPCFEYSGMTSLTDYVLKYKQKALSKGDKHKMAEALSEGVPPLPRIAQPPEGRWVTRYEYDEVEAPSIQSSGPGSRSRSRRSRSISASSHVGTAAAGGSPDRRHDPTMSHSRSRSPFQAVPPGFGSAAGVVQGVWQQPPSEDEGVPPRVNMPRRWVQGPAPRTLRRMARADQHRAACADGTRHFAPGMDETLGPVAIGNPCAGCDGRNQFAFACKAKPKRCRTCCMESPRGPCAAHV